MKRLVPAPPRPTPADLLTAAGRSVPDVIAPNLRVLFCGINPSLYSGFTGHHFARPGNRFWPTLYAAGFTERLLAPAEERELLASGYGITNIVNHATASAAELSAEDLVKGGKTLLEKADRFRPRILAILGVSAYRIAFGKDDAKIGRQAEPFGPSTLWILPNPSGLNAHYTPSKLAQVFRTLRDSL